jgi:hypothetical protein
MTVLNRFRAAKSTSPLRFFTKNLNLAQNLTQIAKFYCRSAKIGRAISSRYSEGQTEHDARLIAIASESVNYKLNIWLNIQLKSDLDFDYANSER